MPNRANPYGYSDPGIGQAFSKLATALFGSAEGDTQAAAMRASDALASQRLQAMQAAAAFNNTLDAAARVPLLQGQIAQAMGLGPVHVDESGGFVRPVGPNGPQMSVPALPGVTPDQLGSLARAFLGAGGNTQQTMAGLGGLGDAVNKGLAAWNLRNPGQVPEDVLRGAAVQLHGAGGVGPDFSPTAEAARRNQDYINQRDFNNHFFKFRGKQYEVDNTPVTAGTGQTVFLPQPMQGLFGGQAQLQGIPPQVPPVILDPGEIAYPGFGGKSSLQGGPLIPKGTASGGKAKTPEEKPEKPIPSGDQSRIAKAIEDWVGEKGYELASKAEIGQRLRESAARIYQAGSKNTAGAVNAIFQALANGNRVDGMRIANLQDTILGFGVPFTEDKTIIHEEADVINARAGDIFDGYRFKGGAPEVAANWEKI